MIASSVTTFRRSPANDGFDPDGEVALSFGDANDNCGYSIASGDFNGDGLGDALMGCGNGDNGGANSGYAVVFVRRGDNAGFETGVQLPNPWSAAGDQCGGSVAAGDVNGDGRDDVVMGCPVDDNEAVDAGSTILFVRNAANNGFDAGVLLANPDIGVPVWEHCGYSVATADVNDDGLGDVLSGCVYTDTWHGGVLVYVRKSDNTGFETGITLSDPALEVGALCGSVVRGGDVNGDGRDDVIIACGSKNIAASDAGGAVVFTRDAANTGFDVGVELFDPAPAADDKCGYNPESLAVGDVNGDGRSDIALGCWVDDNGGNDSGNTIVFVRDGANTGFDIGVELPNPTPVNSDGCAYSVVIGDMNGDGRGDVVAGCYLDDTGDYELQPRGLPAEVR